MQRLVVRIILVWVAMLFAWWGGAPTVEARAQRIQLPPVTRVTLDNGAQVVLMEYHRAPSLQITALFTGGSALDPTGKAGVASLTATLLRKGTDTRNATQLAEEIDTLGGSLEAAATDERIEVDLSVLSKDTTTGLDLFTDIIRHPTLPEEELNRERQLEISGLQAIGEDPGAIANRVADETAYAGHPYGVDSTITSLKAIGRDDLRSYYTRVFAPNRLILVAVGDFKTAEMLERLKAKFSDWPRNPEPVPPTPPVPNSVRRALPTATQSNSKFIQEKFVQKIVLIDKPDATQTQVRWIRTAFARNSADYFPARVAEAILGVGFTSRLTNEIRVNRSLTYGISSQFAPQLAGGDFTVSTFTKIETTRALLDATTAVLRQTSQKGFTEMELKKFKSYLAGQFAIQVQSPEALAAQLANIAFYRLPTDYLQTYLLRLHNVTLPEANRIATTYFRPGALSLVLVAPASRIKSQLAALIQATGSDAFEVRPVDTVGK